MFDRSLWELRLFRRSGRNTFAFFGNAHLGSFVEGKHVCVGDVVAPDSKVCVTSGFDGKYAEVFPFGNEAQACGFDISFFYADLGVWSCVDYHRLCNLLIRIRFGGGSQ